MKRKLMIIKFAITLTMIIGTGLKTDSQNKITEYQLMQIRLLDNQAKTDSLKVIELSNAIDTLKTTINLTNLRLQNCKTTNELLYEKINLQVDLVENERKKTQIAKKEKRKQIRTRNLIIIGQAILQTLLIYKTIK